MRIAPVLALSPEQQTLLESWARSRSFPARVVERARIVLRAATNEQDQDIAASMAITPKKVSRWRKRFLALGVEGLKKDAPRPCVADCDATTCFEATLHSVPFLAECD